MMHALFGQQRRSARVLRPLADRVVTPRLATMLACAALATLVSASSPVLADGARAGSAVGAADTDPYPVPPNNALRAKVLIAQAAEKPAPLPAVSQPSPRSAMIAAPASVPTSLPTPTTIGPRSATGNVPPTPGTALASASHSGEVAGGLGQVALVLVLIVGLIALMAWLLRRLGGTRVGAGNLIQILSSVALGSRERIMLLEIADQWIVVGVTSAAITTLTTMPRQEHRPGTGPFAVPPMANNFAYWLKRTMAKQNPANPQDGVDPGPRRHGGPGKSAYGGANNSSGTIDGI